MPATTPQRIREHLDVLAGMMADATDGDDRVAAWRILRHVEQAVELACPGDIPAAPVLARRFARAHARALRLADTDPQTLARVLLRVGDPALSRHAPAAPRTRTA